jgi:hypothetical protein
MTTFLPYEHLTITTYFSPEMARQKLAGVIEPRRMRFGLLSRGHHKPYQGEISGDQFKISRIIYYRNSFLHVISGKLEPDLKGTRLDIKMGLHPFVVVFMAVWFGGVGLAVMATSFAAFSAFTQGGGRAVTPLFPFLIPWGMLIFGYLMVIAGFKFEATKAETFFRELFAGGY